MGSKTPVSIVTEYFVAQGITPSFRCISCSGASHKPEFVYEVYATDDFIAQGCGPSKQKAKHEAAQNLLDLIKSDMDKAPVGYSTQLNTVLNDISCPQQNCISINAVGDLLSYCTIQNLPEPVYVCLLEDGPPHQRTFTFKCTVSHLSENGAGRTKKEAKHKSAYNMLIRLRGLYGEKLTELVTVQQSKADIAEKEASNKIRDEEITKIYMTRTPRLNVTSSLCITNHRMFNNYLEQSLILNKLVALDDTNDDDLKNHIVTLKKIADELDIKYEVNELRLMSGEVNSICVSMAFPSRPLSYYGATEELAASRLVNHIKNCCW